MTWEQVASIASIVSSVAVLATLIYLAVQTKQTSSALLAASRQGTMAADVEMLSASYSSLDIFSLVLKDSSELTDSESYAVGCWCAAFVRIREFAWFQYKAGIMDESTWQSYVSPAKRILSHANFRLWWDRFSEEVDPEFRAYMDGKFE